MAKSKISRRKKNQKSNASKGKMDHYLHVYLTREECCDLLRITLATLDKYRRIGIIPFVTIGRRVLIPREALMKILEERLSSSIKGRRA